MTTELAATKDGKILAMRIHVLADHGAFDACADPSRWPAGFMNILHRLYDIPVRIWKSMGLYQQASAASPIVAPSG